MISIKALSKVPATILTKLGPAGLALRKYAPEILLGGGILGTVGGTVLACKATLKVPDILAERNAALSNVNDDYLGEVATQEEAEEIVESQEYKKAVTGVYVRTGFEIAKKYIPASVATIAGIGCIIGSHNIQAGRIAGLAAAYSAATTTLNEYRGRVRDEIGEERELEMYRNIQNGTVEVTKTLKDGNQKTVKKRVKTLDPSHRSMYTFIFDEANSEFTNIPSYNKNFVVCQEAYANQKYDIQGYLYLNDVLESLGFDTKDLPWTRVVGWVKGMGDDYIDFGIFEAYDPVKCDFVNGCEPAIWLDFNCDGYIFDKLGLQGPVANDEEEYLRVTKEIMNA